jgi:hypothetical protein
MSYTSLFFFLWRCDPTRVMASSFLRFLDHTQRRTTVGRTSNQLVTETSTWQHTTLTTDKHPCPAVGFEPTISAGELPQTYALDRAATGDRHLTHRLLVTNIQRLSSYSASAVKVITLLVSNQLPLVFGLLLPLLSAADLAVPVSTSPTLYVTLSYSAVLTRASLCSASPAKLIQSTQHTCFCKPNIQGGLKVGIQYIVLYWWFFSDIDSLINLTLNSVV